MQAFLAMIVGVRLLGLGGMTLKAAMDGTFQPPKPQEYPETVTPEYSGILEAIEMYRNGVTGTPKPRSTSKPHNNGAKNILTPSNAPTMLAPQCPKISAYKHFGKSINPNATVLALARKPKQNSNQLPKHRSKPKF